jgi:hypothetical protein
MLGSASASHVSATRPFLKAIWEQMRNISTAWRPPALMGCSRFSAAGLQVPDPLPDRCEAGIGCRHSCFHDLG